MKHARAVHRGRRRRAGRATASSGSSASCWRRTTAGARVGEYHERLAATAADPGVDYAGIESLARPDPACARLPRAAASRDGLGRAAGRAPRCCSPPTASPSGCSSTTRTPTSSRAIGRRGRRRGRARPLGRLGAGVAVARAARPSRGAGPTSSRCIADLAATGRADGVLVCPQGFVSDHLEVLYDLDVEAARRRRRGRAGLRPHPRRQRRPRGAGGAGRPGPRPARDRARRPGGRRRRHHRAGRGVGAGRAAAPTSLVLEAADAARRQAAHHAVRRPPLDEGADAFLARVPEAVELCARARPRRRAGVAGHRRRLRVVAGGRAAPLPDGHRARRADRPRRRSRRAGIVSRRRRRRPRRDLDRTEPASRPDGRRRADRRAGPAPARRRGARAPRRPAARRHQRRRHRPPEPGGRRRRSWPTRPPEPEPRSSGVPAPTPGAAADRGPVFFALPGGMGRSSTLLVGPARRRRRCASMRRPARLERAEPVARRPGAAAPSRPTPWCSPRRRRPRPRCSRPSPPRPPACWPASTTRRSRIVTLAVAARPSPPTRSTAAASSSPAARAGCSPPARGRRASGPTWPGRTAPVLLRASAGRHGDDAGARRSTTALVAAGCSPTSSDTMGAPGGARRGAGQPVAPLVPAVRARPPRPRRRRRARPRATRRPASPSPAPPSAASASPPASARGAAAARCGVLTAQTAVYSA